MLEHESLLWSSLSQDPQVGDTTILVLSAGIPRGLQAKITWRVFLSFLTNEQALLLPLNAVLRQSQIF